MSKGKEGKEERKEEENKCNDSCSPVLFLPVSTWRMSSNTLLYILATLHLFYLAEFFFSLSRCCVVRNAGSETSPRRYLYICDFLIYIDDDADDDDST